MTDLKTRPLKQQLQTLLKLADAASPVVAWYAHGNENGTVRGPFHRWFTCSEVEDRYKQHVASVDDDCRYAAAAMNAVPTLVKVLQVAIDFMDYRCLGVRLEDECDHCETKKVIEAIMAGERE